MSAGAKHKPDASPSSAGAADGVAPSAQKKLKTVLGTATTPIAAPALPTADVKHDTKSGLDDRQPVESQFPVARYMAECVQHEEWRDLLRAEVELMHQTERVARMRRALPRFKVTKSYAFDVVDRGTGCCGGSSQTAVAAPSSSAALKQMSLEELFGGKKYLIVDFMMFDPDDALPCSMCSSWADVYDAAAPHVNAKADTAFVLVSKVQGERLAAYAAHRKWAHIPLVSSFGNTFNVDFGAQSTATGDQVPLLACFAREPDGSITHTYSTQMSTAPFEHRGIDPYNPLWALLDITPGGRGMHYPVKPTPYPGDPVAAKQAAEAAAKTNGTAGSAATAASASAASASASASTGDAKALALPKQNTIHYAKRAADFKPKIVSNVEWVEARKQLLAKEKTLSRVSDSVVLARQQMPWTEVTTDYVFVDSAADAKSGGAVKLSELFSDPSKTELAVWHMMYAPEWSKGCSTCCFWLDGFNGQLKHITAKCNFVAIAKAPAAALATIKAEKGWAFRLVSSLNTTFNADFGVELTDAFTAKHYNFGSGFSAPVTPPKQLHGMSVFHRDPSTGKVYRTYSAYSRGIDIVNAAHQLFDFLPFGREAFWPKHHYA